MFPNDNKPDNPTDDINEIQTISHYASLLWKWAWLLLLVGGVCAGIAYFITQQMTPIYETSTSLLVLNAPYNTDQYYSSIQASQSLASTYANVLGQDALLGEVISRLGLTTTPDTLSKSISITPKPSTQMIVINAKGPDRILASKIANTLVTVFIDKMMSTQADRYATAIENLQKELDNIDGLIQSTAAEKEAAQDQAEKDKLDLKLGQYREMYASMLNDYEKTRLEDIQATSNIVQISPAGISYSQASPKVFPITVVVGVMAMALVAGLIFIKDALDKTLKTPEEITQKLKLPVLGIIYKYHAGDQPISLEKPDSPTAEAFRLLGTRIQYADTEPRIHSIMVTSPTKVEGKSTISINLAIVLAQAGNIVTLIDTNFDHPTIHHRLHLSNDVGLTELLTMEKLDLSKKGILQKGPVDNLSIISSGAKSSDESNINVSNNFGGVLDALTDENKLVVIDSAPALSMADTVVLSTMADGLLLVVQAGKTTLTEARQAIKSLLWVNARVIGVVINNFNYKSSKPWLNLTKD
jgi:tyrosine-protein kinase